MKFRKAFLCDTDIHNIKRRLKRKKDKLKI